MQKAIEIFLKDSNFIVIALIPIFMTVISFFISKDRRRLLLLLLFTILLWVIYLVTLEIQFFELKRAIIENYISPVLLNLKLFIKENLIVLKSILY